MSWHFRGRRREGGRAGRGRGQTRARPASHKDERRRFWLPAEALVELVGRDCRERRIGGRDLCPLMQASNLMRFRHLVPKT